MKVVSRNRYQITVKRDYSYSVISSDGRNHFLSPDTKPGQKLYLVGLNQCLHYVGITNTPMASRINMGVKAKGRSGYYGYKWKTITNPLSLDVLCWSGKGAVRSALESIEAEIAYLCRKSTGNWPMSQTEIHFRPPSDEQKEMAKLIYAGFYDA